jgi:GntR family transcriptional regulator, arabinose operon transcriptional repressor
MQRKTTTVYATLKTDLIEQIKSRELKPGMSLLPENTLARNYGISRPSVRNALCELEKANLIVRRAGKGSFVKDSSMHAEKLSNHIITIGMDLNLEGYIPEWYSAKIIKGIKNACSKKNYRLTVIDINELATLPDNYVDGVVLSMINNFNEAEAIARRGIPVVLLNRLPECPELAYLAVDYVKEARKATEYLLASGHHDIGFITGLPGYMSDTRKRGFEQALEDFGLRAEPDKYMTCPSYYNLIEPMMKYLSRQKLSAVFISNATYLFPFWQACEKVGVRIPEDLSIICFDDVDEFSRTIGVGISEVKMPLERMGQKAVDYLERKLTMGTDIPILREIVGAQLIIKDSCKINRKIMENVT